jgi:glucose/arabinose dehydrogenase
MLRFSVLTIAALLTSLAYAEETELPFISEPVATFSEPWAMTFLPDGRLLVTEKRGRLYIVTQDGEKSRPVEELPNVDYRGHGGLGDVILHPEFASNGLIYLSYAESAVGNVRGAAVARAKLILKKDANRLEDVDVIWRQNPKMTDDGHYGHRMVFDADGFLFISSGDRQKLEPAQYMTGNVGKIVRVHDDGSIPEDNPFADKGDVTAEIWSLGHRNPFGLAFDDKGRLWSTEMGPLNGDELNLLVKGENYGWPIVSEGIHYNGDPIPNHDTHPEFQAPKAFWVPTIAPANLIFYSGEMFPDFNGSALISGLASKAIIRVSIDGDSAREEERYDMGERVREVEQGPDGAIWVLEDGEKGRLLKLTPAAE